MPPVNAKDPQDILVVAPNFKKRLSGVTSTVVRLVPIQAKSIGIVALAPSFPDDIPQISLSKLLFLPERKNGGWRVWHARRNVEMIFGLFLRHVLRRRYRLLFTSASQRKHTNLTKFLIDRMDAVIATSEKTAAYLTVDNTVIYHGIDTEKFSPPDDRSDLRDKYSIPKDATVLGCIGRIRHQKGTDLFVDACLQLCAQNPKVHGVVIGRATAKDEGYLRDLKQKVADAGYADRIVFHEEVPVWEIANYYKCLDIYIAPQRWEGFGLTPLEAMACGVPVVATDVGAFAEIIEDGSTGFVVTPSATELADAATKLLADDNLLARFSRNARAHIEANFDIHIEASKIVQVYKRLLG